MIGQYLSNTNERAIVSILQNILELNKALFTGPKYVPDHRSSSHTRLFFFDSTRASGSKRKIIEEECNEDMDNSIMWDESTR